MPVFQIINQYQDEVDPIYADSYSDAVKEAESISNSKHVTVIGPGDYVLVRVMTVGRDECTSHICCNPAYGWAIADKTKELGLIRYDPFHNTQIDDISRRFRIWKDVYKARAIDAIQHLINQPKESSNVVP